MTPILWCYSENVFNILSEEYTQNVNRRGRVTGYGVRVKQPVKASPRPSRYQLLDTNWLFVLLLTTNDLRLISNHFLHPFGGVDFIFAIFVAVNKIGFQSANFLNDFFTFFQSGNHTNRCISIGSHTIFCNNGGA